MGIGTSNLKKSVVRIILYASDMDFTMEKFFLMSVILKNGAVMT